MGSVLVHYVLDGKKSSVTVDSLMFNVFAIKCGTQEDARRSIRMAIQNGLCVSTKDMTMSKSVQNMIFRECCRPSLITRYDNFEGQFDIEDFDL
jgi:hypothetical protein